MAYKEIIKIVPGLQATALAVRATEMVPKNPKMKIKKPAKRFLEGSTKILFGTALIKPTAKMINDL